MARLPRLDLPGCPQHVIWRGNNRHLIFAADDDYAFLLEALFEASAKHACAIHAYVLMTNHLHLLLTPASGTGISQFMQSVGRKYVRYFNHLYRRTGTLFEGRYKSALVESEHYLLTCMRYIELNPVRAGMVEHPSEYPWSSYQENGGLIAHRYLAEHELFTRLGPTRSDRCVAYRELFRTSIDTEDITSIRAATQRSNVIGHQKFKEELERHLERRILPAPLGGDRRSAAWKVKKGGST